MNKIIKRTISAVLSLCMLLTMFSMLATVAFADSEYDSGNMPKGFFTNEYWDVADDNTSVYELADGSLKFTTTKIKDIGSYYNDGFETMFKAVGGFELTFRANSDASEGYVFGIVAPANTSKGSNYNFYIRKGTSKTYLAETYANINGFFYGDWVKLGVHFTDKNGATEIEFAINDVKLNFFLSGNSTNQSYAAEFEGLSIRNGNLVDYNPVNQKNSYIKIRPYYNGGFESSPNKDNQLYFASIESAGKVTEGNFVTRIAVVGDSISQGVGASNARINSYVAYLQKMLGPNYDVYNCGASANTAMTGTYQTYIGQVIYFSAMLFNPDYVIFALGSNDGQSSYWDHFYYYGPSTDKTNNDWRSVNVSTDDDGNYIDSVKYASDGTTVSEKVTVNSDGTINYYFLDPNGTARTYNNIKFGAEEKFINQAGNIINSFAKNNYRSDAHAKVIISSALHTWAGIAETWNRQEEAFNAQKKLAEQNENVIGFIDNYTLTAIYNEDSTSENYYRNFSDDALHPNSAGHLILANNIYSYLQNFDLTTEDKAISYTSYGNTNTDVEVHEINGGADTQIVPAYFSASGKAATSTTTTGNLEYGTVSSVNKVDLGFKFDASISMAYKWVTGACTYSTEITDFTQYPCVRHSFGDLELRMWRVVNDSNAPGYVFGLFYKDQLVGNYQYWQSSNTGYSTNCGEKLTLDISFDSGNMTVSMKRVFNSTTYSNIESWDTSSAESVVVYSIDKDTFLAGIGAAAVSPINNIRYSASGQYCRGAMLTSVALKATGAQVDYNIQTTTGGKIYADGVVFDNTVDRYVGDEVVLNAVIDDTTYYRFNSWQDSKGNVLSTETEYYVCFDENTDVIAVFDEIPYCDYTITADNGGSILMDGEAFVDGTLYEVGYEHTISAVADEGYTFGGWMGENNQIVSLDSNYTFTIGDTLTLNAIFVPTVYADSFSAVTVGGGKAEYTQADRYIVGTYVKVAAIIQKNYDFYGWYDANDNLISKDLVFYYQIQADNALTAKFEYVLYSNFTVTADNGTVTVNGKAFNPEVKYYAGDTYTLVAAANDGYTFEYWKVNGTVVSTDAEYTIRLAATSDVEAVFTAANTENVTVVFTNRAGKIVTSVTVAKGGTVTLPELPVTYGYTYNGWNVNGAVKAPGETVTADSDMVITANAVVNATKYTVTVSGSANDDELSGEYSYNDKITAVFDSSVLGAGKYFGGWADNNNNIISYAETYTFFVGADVSVVAVIAAESAEAVPVIAVTDVAVINDGQKVSFLSQRTVPVGYKLAEAGVIYTANADLASTMDRDSVGGAVKQKTALQNSGNGQFRLTVSSREGTAITVYLRAYLTYVNADGDYVTIYSPVYSGSTVASDNVDTGIEEGIEDNF